MATEMTSTAPASTRPEGSTTTSDRGDGRPRARPFASRNDGRLLDLKGAEAYSGISAWTLRDLIASGHLVAVRPPGLRRVWIDRQDLDRAIAQWKEGRG
jgi:excisionase family DNA binding protein